LRPVTATIKAAIAAATPRIAPGQPRISVTTRPPELTSQHDSPGWTGSLHSGPPPRSTMTLMITAAANARRSEPRSASARIPGPAFSGPAAGAGGGGGGASDGGGGVVASIRSSLLLTGP